MAITYHSGRRIQLLEADRTVRQGFDGGEGHQSGYTSGGGGGSSSVGVNATSTKAGDGGAGTQSDITGTATYYSAGGGGGIWGTGTTVGSGGSSIGGNGSSANNAGGNASGYGSGGGGAGVQSGAGQGVSQTGGNGSAGIVILRFTTSGNTYSQVGGTVDTSTVSGETIITYTATSGTTTFTPSASFDVRYLVIGGGAGGGSSKAGFAGGGGAGAGGFRTATGHGVTAQTYNITVGSAGAGGVAGSGNGSNGNDSIFDTITSLGGGGGARGMNTSGSVGQNGASGGGACPYFVTSFGTGTTTDVTPTNVQIGSRLEETDTRKMYSFADVSTDGLKAYYKFDESSGNIINKATTVGSSDSLGTDADMTISGATYSQTGKIGNALSFDGSNDFGTLGSSLSQWNFFHGTGDWTLNYWINFGAFTSEAKIFSNLDSTETRGINVRVGGSDPDGTIGLSIKSDNGFMVNTGSMSFNQTLSTGTWYMITLTCDHSLDSANYQVSVNGTGQGTANRSVLGSGNNAEYSTKIMRRGGSSDGFVNADIDEMSIWNRLLTADEITSLYNSNSGRAISSGLPNFTQWKEIGT